MNMDSVSRIKPASLLKLVAAAGLCLVLGSIGSIVTITGPGSWYSLLVKPAFQPPSWLFAPVWTLLFVLMGIALFLVWDLGTSRPGVRSAIVLFGIQFALNVAWSFLFFGLRSPALGLLDIIVLWWLILATTVTFYRLRPVAGYLLLPYLAWVSFATVLNASIMYLNP